jgi:AcrR family transcriptional regulator
MPKGTFFRLPDAKRQTVIQEAITEFAERSFAEASLSEIARRAEIPKGSFYQYFEDKLDLYRWLLTEEAPRCKRAYMGSVSLDGDYWGALEDLIERGMAFLVEHPRLARLTAAAADPTALVEVRGLHKAVCDAGNRELRAVVQEGIRSGAISSDFDVDLATRMVAAVIGPGLTEIVLAELGAELHEVLASDSLRRRLGPRRRRRLAHQAVLFIRHGLGTTQR